MYTLCEHSEGNNFKEISFMSFAIGDDGYVRVVAKKLCCPECIEKYKKMGTLLANDAEEELWVSGESIYPIVLNKTAY